MTTPHPRIRVLHVVNRLDRGGVETWLLNLLRHIDRSRFQFDFLVHSIEPGAYDDDVRSLGAAVYPCLQPSRPISYARNFRRILRERGPFDVVHSHVQHFNGVIMALAAAHRIPVRIAHSHLNTGPLETNAHPARRTYLGCMRRAIQHCSTVRLAASAEARQSLFRSQAGRAPSETLYCGIDASPFSNAVDRREVRRELGLPLDAFVVGHIANFRPQKNHAFTVAIAESLANREDCVRILFVGDGCERKTIETLVAKAGLQDRVVFAGSRSDVPRLLRGAIDAVILPSHSEGLPLVGIEAQLAGVPLLLSDNVTHEISVVPELVQHLSLEAGSDVWAEALLAGRDLSYPQAEAMAKVTASHFNIAVGAARLETIYAGF